MKLNDFYRHLQLVPSIHLKDKLMSLHGWPLQLNKEQFLLNFCLQSTFAVVCSLDKCLQQFIKWEYLFVWPQQSREWNLKHTAFSGMNCSEISVTFPAIFFTFLQFLWLCSPSNFPGYLDKFIRISYWMSYGTMFLEKFSCTFGVNLMSLTFLLSASLYVSKRGAYWDRLCRDVVGWLVVGCHARALWPNGAS